MIHTGEFFVMLDKESDSEVIEMMRKVKVYTTKESRIVCRTTNIHNHKIIRLHIYVDFIELLDRSNITPEDCDEIISRVEEIVEEILNTKDFKLSLSRIDFRYDVVIKEKELRKLIISLLEKGLKKAEYMRKIDKYKGSIRYFSKSRSDNFYDKEKQCLEKGRDIKYYEKDVLRFEAQIKNEHIKYRNKKYSMERSLKEYFTYDNYRVYMTKMIIDIVGRGDFYSLIEAEKIINASSVSNKKKKELREFLVYTSNKRSLTETKKNYSRYSFDKNISILKELGINPIVIPEKNGVRKLGVKYIKNPLNNLINLFDV